MRQLLGQSRRPASAITDTHAPRRRRQLPDDLGFCGVGRGEHGGLNDAVAAGTQVQTEAVKRLADAGRMPLRPCVSAPWCAGAVATSKSGLPPAARPRLTTIEDRFKN